MSSIPVTAAVVRAHFQGDETALGALSEAAQATVRKGARGRLHPEVREAYNKGRKPSQRYTEGTPRMISLSYRHTQPSGRTVKREVAITEAEARSLASEAGVEVGKRGPLSKAGLVAAGEQYAKSLV
jgi:hypothetical protein